jgi:hypothetical protein
VFLKSNLADFNKLRFTMLNQSVLAYQEIKTGLVGMLKAHKQKRSISFLNVFRFIVNYSVLSELIFPKLLMYREI